MRSWIRLVAVPALAALAAACGDEFEPTGSSAGSGGSGGASSGTGQGGHAGAGDGDCPADRMGPDLVKLPAPGGGAFCIDKTEVTNGDYQAWLGTAPAPADQDSFCAWNDSFGSSPTGDSQLPVVDVDWCDAFAYCKGVGKTLCGRIGGGANPFQSYGDSGMSQWYSACSEGGTKEFPYGESYVPNRCVTWDYNGVPGPDNGDAARPVAEAFSCSVGLLGIFDMSGNVFEWENSCEAYNGAADTCRVRGGAFFDGELAAMCSSGATRPRTVAAPGVGFRCCYDL